MNTNSYEAGPLAEVECAPDGDRWTLTFVRELRHPPEKVWAALTDPDQLREWAPFVPSRNIGDVGDATLTMIDGETKTDLDAVVSRAEPPNVLEYTWGGDLLRWDLEPSDSGTRLTLRHRVDDVDMVAKVAAGWHICLVVADRLLADHPLGPIVGQDAMNYGWQDLYEGYAGALGLSPSDPN